MSMLPGGRLSFRPLHFIWVCDCSASMGLDGRIEALNAAVREAMPHMLEVAEANPNAEVMVRTMRFSSGVSWVTPEPVELSQFEWTDLEADDLPMTAQFSAEFRDRILREGAKSGDVQIALAWNNYNDLDLHVICPGGEEIDFTNKTSACGGELDVDMNVAPDSEEPIENVFWPSDGAPLGHYQVLVHHYQKHGERGCADPTPFRVEISIGGSVQEFSGSISSGDEPILIHEFDVDESVVAGTSAGGNTSVGAALVELSRVLSVPPMTERALPPVIVLMSDGQPTDDWQAGLSALMAQPWGKKAARVAIAIGADADQDVLQEFIGHSELRPLQANNPEALVARIKWLSTAVLKAASMPASQTAEGHADSMNVPIPRPPPDLISAEDVW